MAPALLEFTDQAPPPPSSFLRTAAQAPTGRACFWTLSQHKAARPLLSVCMSVSSVSREPLGEWDHALLTSVFPAPAVQYVIHSVFVKVLEHAKHRAGPGDRTVSEMVARHLY